jgi:hypothetical protein
LPDQIEGLFDRATFGALTDEPPFELVDESQGAPVVVGQGLLARDGDEAA